MPRNFHDVKLAMGSRNPYPHRRTNSLSGLPLLAFPFLLLLSCSVNNLQNAQMPRNLPLVKLATGSRNPGLPNRRAGGKFVSGSLLTIYISSLTVLFCQ